MKKLTCVQKAAYNLIQSDARFLYTLTDIQDNANNIDSNYIMMCQPYIGIFTDGAEQWCKKVGLTAPAFNKEEKKYYGSLRQSHKLFEQSYTAYMQLLKEKFKESDNHFYSIRTLREKILGYYNVGTDICYNEFCGNTITTAMYMPINIFDKKNIGTWIKNISIISGKLADYFECTKFPPYKYDDSIMVTYKDYHFYKNCPLKIKNEFGLLLFSIICSINYVTKFIDRYFVEEIPQKFKFAYLQYYYLCDFIKELNLHNGTDFHIDDSMINRDLRNCFSHYGLGQYMSESEIMEDDILKGLTNKAFNMSYTDAKAALYTILDETILQIKRTLL